MHSLHCTAAVCPCNPMPSSVGATVQPTVMKFTQKTHKSHTCTGNLMDISCDACKSAVEHFGSSQAVGCGSYSTAWPQGCFKRYDGHYFFNAVGNHGTPSNDGRRICGGPLSLCECDLKQFMTSMTSCVQSWAARQGIILWEHRVQALCADVLPSHQNCMSCTTLI